MGVISYISSNSCVLRTEQDSENKHWESPQEGVVVVGHQCQTGGQEVHVQQSLLEINSLADFDKILIILLPKNEKVAI